MNSRTPGISSFLDFLSAYFCSGVMKSRTGSSKVPQGFGSAGPYGTLCSVDVVGDTQFSRIPGIPASSHQECQFQKRLLRLVSSKVRACVIATIQISTIDNCNIHKCDCNTDVTSLSHKLKLKKQFASSKEERLIHSITAFDQ
jgi:hypothetical protein